MSRRQTPRHVRTFGAAVAAAALVWWSGASAPRAQSGGYGAALFKALEWRNIGPERGGRSIASTGVVGRPLEYYFGAVGGGLWKTTDGGVTWNPVTDGQLKSSSVGAVAASDSNPDVVYIGMGEVCLRGNIMQGDGVYKSTDAGKSWTHMGLDDSQVIARIVVSPKDPDLVYVAAFGHVAGPSDERGVYRSKDGGKTWQRVLFRDAKTGAVDLVMDRNNPNVLYAALWEAYRLSYTMSSGGPGSGFFKTTDGGDTWTELTRKPGLPDGIDGRIGLAASPADANRVWALVENETGGVFRSDDGGQTWTRTNDERTLRQRAFYYTHIFADPKNRDVVYVMNTGFYRSTDGGKTFPGQIRVPHGDNHDLWIDPNDPNRMIGSNDGGGTVSTNGGLTWTDEDYPTAQFYHVTTTNDFPYHVCGAQQDNTTACVSSEPRAGGGGGTRTAPVFYQVGGGESGYIASSPTDNNVFYAGSQGALITKFNRQTDEVRDIQVYPWFFSGEPSSALKERWQWTFPIVFSPKSPHVLYATSQHLWKTTNDGQTWQRISPDLTLADPKTLGHSGGPITGDMNGPEIFAMIFALAPSPLDESVIWTGSDDGLLYVTRDGGKNWTNVTPPDLPKLSRVSIIDASAHDPGTAYCAANRYLLDDRAPYIYRTRDYGKTWARIVSGIRADDYAHAVREDPRKQGLLYAGTEHGIWISFDAGDHWQSLSLNLPDTQVADLVVKDNDLVIGTHGRAFYVLDDISPLRQMSPEAAAADVYLFQPSPAVRSGNQAAIYYTLKQPADKITIEILDAKGAVVQTYSQTAADEAKAAGRPAEGGGFFRRGPEPPSTKAGLDEFNWDLRYPGHTTFPGMILWSASSTGPLAVPGTYQVRLTAAFKTLTRSFEVKENPLYTDVTPADLQAQFDLAIQIRDRTSDANNAVIKIRAIKTQVDDRLGRTKDTRVVTTGETLKRKLSAVEEELYQVRNRSNQDPLNFPIKLNNRLASLRRSVETGDARPTDASYVVFKEESALLDQQLGLLEETLQTEMAAFNDALKRAKLEPIVVK